MADFSNKAKLIFSKLNDGEQEKALSVLKTLDGLEVERASWILDFCKSSIETKAIVKV